MAVIQMLQTEEDHHPIEVPQSARERWDVDRIPRFPLLLASADLQAVVEDLLTR